MLSLLLALATAPQDDFAVILIPDTQNYSRSSTFIANFIAQTQWVVDHLVDERIVFVSHVGDIVQDGEQGTNRNFFEWNNADTAMRRLDGNPAMFPDARVPYSAAIGNHDYVTVGSKTSGTARYVEFFGPDRYAGRSWYRGASADGLNHMQVFDSPEGEWLHVAIEWRPSDDAISFAREAIAQHPGLPAIVTTHEHLSAGLSSSWRTGGSTPDSSGNNSAEQVFRKLVEPNPEVALVLCGHVIGSGYRTNLNAYGRPVHQILMDFQGDPEGGNGWLTRLGFDVAAQQLRVRTSSPTFMPGVSMGADRTQDPTANFDLGYDAAGHRASLLGSSVLRVRQGDVIAVGPYTSAIDTYIGNGAAGATPADMPFGDSLNVRCDGDADREQGLVAFGDLIGNGPGQIPPGTAVVRAILTLTTEGASAESSTGGTLHRMLTPWDESTTWDDLVGGVQIGTEASALADDSSAGDVLTKGTRSFDVTASVQAWANGAPNHGWLIQAAGDDRWSFRSSEWPAAAERPLLTIQYEGGCPEPTTDCVNPPNTTGTSGQLVVTGSSSIAANDLALVASSLPANSLALFVSGTESAALPAGGGLFCLGGTVLRLPPAATADLLGQVALPFTQPAGLFPGDVLRFQCWHRDMTPAGSNFTNAIEVTFCE